MRILRRAISCPVPILAWTLALLVVGAIYAGQVPVEWVPEIELPEARISARWPGATPEAVERRVTTPLERAVQGIAGTENVESLSRQGESLITLRVNDGVNLATYVARVNERLDLVQRTLPRRVTPQINKRVPEALRNQQGFITLQLAGTEPPWSLRRYADEELAPRLRSLSGVADVVVRGGRRSELRLTLHPSRLIAYGISHQQVRRRLFDAASGKYYGSVRHSGYDSLLFTPAQTRVERLKRLVVMRPDHGSQPIHLSEVGTLKIAPASRQSITRINGNPVVTLEINRAPDKPLLQTSERVRAQLRELRPNLPDGVRLLVADDKSESVRTQLHDLAWQGSIALVLMLLVILTMLRSLRATSIVFFSVTSAIVAGIALMNPLGLTLNLLTIAGFALLIGLLVDNSVVAIEQLFVQRQRLLYRRPSRPTRRGDQTPANATDDHATETSPRTSLNASSDPGCQTKESQSLPFDVAAAKKAMSAVIRPLLGGTLTTIAATMPLLYLSGELRSLVLPFTVLIAVTLGASLITAAVLVPVCGQFLPGRRTVTDSGTERWVRWIGVPYTLASKFPKSSLTLLVLIIGTPLWMLPAELSVPSRANDGGSHGSAVVDTLRSSSTDLWDQAEDRWVNVYNVTIGSKTIQEARKWIDPVFGGMIRPFLRETTFGRSYNYDSDLELYVRLGFPPGTPIERADSLMKQFEFVATASRTVEQTHVRITNQQARLTARFGIPLRENRAPFVVREKMIAKALQIAGVEVLIFGPNIGPKIYYSGYDVRFSGTVLIARGPNYDDLDTLLGEFEAAANAASSRVSGVNTSASVIPQAPSSQKILRISFSPDAEARFGVTASQFTGALRPLLPARHLGQRVAVRGEGFLPVRIEFPSNDSLSAIELFDRDLNVPVTTRRPSTGNEAMTSLDGLGRTVDRTKPRVFKVGELETQFLTEESSTVSAVIVRSSDCILVISFPFSQTFAC